MFPLTLHELKIYQKAGVIKLPGERLILLYSSQLPDFYDLPFFYEDLRLYIILDQELKQLYISDKILKSILFLSFELSISDSIFSRERIEKMSIMTRQEMLRSFLNEISYSDNFDLIKHLQSLNLYILKRQNRIRVRDQSIKTLISEKYKINNKGRPKLYLYRETEDLLQLDNRELYTIEYL